VYRGVENEATSNFARGGIVHLVLAAASTAPCFANSRLHQSIHSRGLQLQNVNGPVEVKGWDRNVKTTVRSPKKKSDLDRVSIEVDAKPNDVSVVTRYPQNEGVEVAVEYTVRPQDARVEHVGTVNAR
jgi:hypothetical protein